MTGSDEPIASEEFFEPFAPTGTSHSSSNISAEVERIPLIESEPLESHAVPARQIAPDACDVSPSTDDVFIEPLPHHRTLEDYLVTDAVLEYLEGFDADRSAGPPGFDRRLEGSQPPPRVAGEHPGQHGRECPR